MNEKASSETTILTFGRLSIFRPLWWILQSIIISIWKTLLILVLIWQSLNILIKEERHAWSREFAGKFVNHVRVWTEYTTWVRDERPKIIEY